MSHGVEEGVVTRDTTGEAAKHREAPPPPVAEVRDTSFLEAWDTGIDARIRAYRHLGNVQVGNTLITCILVGLAILGIATYTFVSLIDVIANSVTVGILLLISVASGVGVIVYGVLRSRKLYTATEAIGFSDYLDALKLSEQNRRHPDTPGAHTKARAKKAGDKAAYK